MAVVNNPVLGYINHPECNTRATVHQARRGRGRFLYTRCDECGCDQRTGKAFQTKLYNNTEWIDGRPEKMPTGAKVEDYKPQSETTQPASTTKENQDSTPGQASKGIVYFIAALAAIGGGLLFITG